MDVYVFSARSATGTTNEHAYVSKAANSSFLARRKTCARRAHGCVGVWCSVCTCICVGCSLQLRGRSFLGTMNDSFVFGSSTATIFPGSSSVLIPYSQALTRGVICTNHHTTKPRSPATFLIRDWQPLLDGNPLSLKISSWGSRSTVLVLSILMVASCFPHSSCTFATFTLSFPK